MTLNFYLIQSPILWLIFGLGAAIGSFLNVVILRVPEGTFFKHARSICPQCQSPIPAKYNIPIFGWLFLRGKTACCKKSISPMYPVVELASAMAFTYIYLRHPFVGFFLGQGEVNFQEILRFVHEAILFSVLFACSVIDIRLMIIPDVLSIPMIILGPVSAAVHPDLTILDSCIGILVGGGFLYLVAWLYWAIRKNYGMGFGDVKLLAAIGGWLGYQGIFPTLFIGSIIGSIIGVIVLAIAKRFSWQEKIPFGPFLALGAMFHIWFGPEILVWMFKS